MKTKGILFASIAAVSLAAAVPAFAGSQCDCTLNNSVTNTNSVGGQGFYSGDVIGGNLTGAVGDKTSNFSNTQTMQLGQAETGSVSKNGTKGSTWATGYDYTGVQSVSGSTGISHGSGLTYAGSGAMGLNGGSAMSGATTTATQFGSKTGGGHDD